MTDANNPKSKAPVFIAYTIDQRNHDESYWTKIGAAWAHEDGKGFNIQLEAVPLNGTITLRHPKPKQ